MTRIRVDTGTPTNAPDLLGQWPDRTDSTSSVPLVEVAPPIVMATPVPSPAPEAPVPSPAPEAPATPKPPPPTPEEIARAAGMKGKILGSASRNIVLKRGEAPVHAIIFVTASGEKYRVIGSDAVCLNGFGTKI